MSDYLEKKQQEHRRLSVLLHLNARPALDDRRLLILRVLSKSRSYLANAALIQETLSDLGQAVTRDLIHGDLAWLDQQGLVRHQVTDDVHGGMLTDQGLNVSAGQLEYPGVALPISTSSIKKTLFKFSIPTSDQELEDCFDDLKEMKLIAICVFEETYILTDKGREVAEGKEQVEGVRVPSPGTIMRTATDMIKGSL
ncbi:hypothetical protein RYZ26_15370 [Terasakiella sp. A23]|uniref:VpaChn25_0724 family phage protein n=1 Tax=Terasakiella sp. FCG-A23 TaxID=3080561 RepID=UPI0029533CC1|nr:hypothetical protein [Terasakiella sp. A23]MDV7340985.1 hypothetical protein [Terasakiella sp. A23]